MHMWFLKFAESSLNKRIYDIIEEVLFSLSLGTLLSIRTQYFAGVLWLVDFYAVFTLNTCRPLKIKLQFFDIKTHINCPPYSLAFNLAPQLSLILKLPLHSHRSKN
jgi:hypothetical protein